MTGRKLVSVVVPCFNEAQVVDQAYARIERALHDLGEALELVFVDDGSADATWERLCALAERDARVVAIRLSRNFGHQLALSAGLERSSGKFVAIIDADLQDPPELIPRMVELAQQGYEVVYGRRRSREGDSALKRLTASAFYRLLDRLSDTEIPRDVGDFRLVSRRVADLLCSMPERDRYVRGMISWLGFRQVALEYDREPRHAGDSKYPLPKMLRLALTGISSFSLAPLRACIYMSYVAFALSLLGMAYVLYSWIALDAVRGWTSLAIVVLFLGGCNLFFIGVLGEYVGKTYIQTKMRPLYIVDAVVGATRTSEPRPD